MCAYAGLHAIVIKGFCKVRMKRIRKIYTEDRESKERERKREGGEGMKLKVRIFNLILSNLLYLPMSLQKLQKLCFLYPVHCTAKNMFT
jgi:hypothetical protein